MEQFVVPMHVMVKVFTGDMVVGEIPDGATIYGVHFSHSRRSFVVTIEHESFAVVPAASRVPERVVSFTSKPSTRGIKLGVPFRFS